MQNKIEIAPAYIEELKTFSISRIASEIRRNWKNVNFAANPYLDAMNSMEKITDNFMADDGPGIVLRFLATLPRGGVRSQK